GPQAVRLPVSAAVLAVALVCQAAHVHRAIDSFATRRSSDLVVGDGAAGDGGAATALDPDALAAGVVDDDVVEDGGAGVDAQAEGIGGDGVAGAVNGSVGQACSAGGDVDAVACAGHRAGAVGE